MANPNRACDSYRNLNTAGDSIWGVMICFETWKFDNSIRTIVRSWQITHLLTYLAIQNMLRHCLYYLCASVHDDVRRLTKQPKLTAIIQLRRLTLFGHIMRMNDNADANRILLASPPADWRRQLDRPRITWLSTIQQDLKHHHLTLPEAADLAQNRPLWRMMSTYGAMQSWVACQKRRRRTQCWIAVTDSDSV